METVIPELQILPPPLNPFPIVASFRIPAKSDFVEMHLFLTFTQVPI
jgi:hypothetical protein